MTNNPHDYFHTLLKQKLLELQEVEEQSLKSAETVELDQSKVGRLSRMDAMQQQAMSQEQLRRRRQEILRIQAALRRIESDDYGYCTACGEEINPQRLKIDPATLFCIRCADQQQ